MANATHSTSRASGDFQGHPAAGASHVFASGNGFHQESQRAAHAAAERTGQAYNRSHSVQSRSRGPYGRDGEAHSSDAVWPGPVMPPLGLVGPDTHTAPVHPPTVPALVPPTLVPPAFVPPAFVPPGTNGAGNVTGDSIQLQILAAMTAQSGSDRTSHSVTTVYCRELCPAAHTTTCCSAQRSSCSCCQQRGKAM